MLRIYQGDCRESLRRLPSESIHTCVTSPPYFGLRDYGVKGQLGLEETPDEYVAGLVEVFREVHRVLRDDGTLWLNLGDSYARAGGWSNNSGLDGLNRNESKRAKSNITGFGSASQRLPSGYKQKDLFGIPWMVAFSLRDDGWYLRQDIIWSKPNPMPESVRDRCTKSHEYIFLLTKSKKYYYDHESIKEPARNWGTRDRSNMRGGTEDPKLKHHGLKGKGWEENPMKNKRSVWNVTARSIKGAHFATFPADLIEPCVLAGSPEGGRVLDPFGGSATTGLVAHSNRRHSILCELNPEYVNLGASRARELSDGLKIKRYTVRGDYEYVHEYKQKSWR
jgi:DNA modification methylase